MLFRSFFPTITINGIIIELTETRIYNCTFVRLWIVSSSCLLKTSSGTYLSIPLHVSVSKTEKRNTFTDANSHNSREEQESDSDREKKRETQLVFFRLTIVATKWKRLSCMRLICFIWMLDNFVTTLFDQFSSSSERTRNWIASTDTKCYGHYFCGNNLLWLNCCYYSVCILERCALILFCGAVLHTCTCT